MTDLDLMEVRLLGLPVDVQRRTSEHYDALLREFELIRQSESAPEAVPDRLLTMIDELSRRFRQFGEQPGAVLQQESERGSEEVDLVYHVPREVVGWCEQLRELLDEADEYCLAGEHLVTLSSTPEVRGYRNWFLQEFVDQSKGEPPTPWTSQARPSEKAQVWPTELDRESATVSLTGDIDLAVAPSIRDHLNQLHADGARDFTIDLSGVTFVDSVGLSVLLSLYRRCREEGGTITVVGPSAGIRRTLEISGLLDILHVE